MAQVADRLLIPQSKADRRFLMEAEDNQPAITFPTDQQIVASIRRAVHAVAVLAAIAYVVGLWFGTMVHQLNDSLASVLSPAQATAAPIATPAQIEQPLAPAPRLVAIAAPALGGMTVPQLRKLAQARGIRNVAGVRASKARKAALLAALA